MCDYYQKLTRLKRDRVLYDKHINYSRVLYDKHINYLEYCMRRSQ